MKCPFCAQELQSGFLNSQSRLYYSQEKRDGGMVFRAEKDDIKLSGPWGAALPVLHCTNCHVIYLSTEFRDKKK